VYILSIVAFIVNLGFGAAMPLIPFLLLSYEGRLTDLPENLGKIEGAEAIAFQITLMVSAFMITRALFARYFGRLSDFLGRKKIIVIGLSIYTFISLAYALSTSWIELLAVRAAQGIASAMVWPVAEAMLADSVYWSERGRYMGWYMTMSNISFFIGPVFGAYLYKFAVQYLNQGIPECFIFPFYILTVLALFGVLISTLTRETIKNDKKFKVRHRIFIQDESEKEPIIIPSKMKRAINVIYIMGFANGIAMGLVAPITQIFIIQYITADPAALGLLSTIAGAVGFTINYPAGYISDKIGRKKVVISGQLTTRVVTFTLPFAKTFEDLVVLYSLRAAAFNIMSPAYRALQADLVPKQLRGKVFGTVQSLFNFGAATAPLGGYLYQIASKWKIYLLGQTIPGIALSFWLSAGIGLFTAILFILFVQEPEKKTREEFSE